jgi:hypothetical protein
MLNGYLETLLDHVTLYFEEKITVLLVNELVTVDALRLVQIQSNQIGHSLNGLWLGKQNALRTKKTALCFAIQ